MTRHLIATLLVVGALALAPEGYAARVGARVRSYSYSGRDARARHGGDRRATEAGVRWWGSPRMGEVRGQDILHFDHQMKTGGTSLSDLMEGFWGPEAVVPGGGRSHHFQHDDLRAAVEGKDHRERLLMATKYRVAYGHFSFDDWLTTLTGKFPEVAVGKDVARTYPAVPPPGEAPPAGHRKPRMHRMTVVREPDFFMASHFNEWICAVKPMTIVRNHLGHDIGTNCAPDMEEVRKVKVDSEIEKCLESRGGSAASESNKAMCQKKAEHRAGFCNDPLAFVRSDFLKEGFGTARSWYFADVCGEYQSPEECYSHALVYFQEHLLVGTTERMFETQCLLHFYTQKPWVDLAHERKSRCNPLDLFSAQARAELDVIAQKTWAVYRAANDVLEHRVGAARQELLQLQAKTGADIASMAHIGPGCFGF